MVQCVSEVFSCPSSEFIYLSLCFVIDVRLRVRYQHMCDVLVLQFEEVFDIFCTILFHVVI